MIPETQRKFSRRGWARLVTAGAAGAAAATPQRPPAAEEQQAARRRLQRGGESMAKFPLPMAAEPAFVFRP